jgi:hypothetical protein
MHHLLTLGGVISRLQFRFFTYRAMRLHVLLQNWAEVYLHWETYASRDLCDYLFNQNKDSGSLLRNQCILFAMEY